MESVRMCRMWSVRAARVARFVEVGRAAMVVDGGGEFIVRVKGILCWGGGRSVVWMLMVAVVRTVGT